MRFKYARFIYMFLLHFLFATCMYAKLYFRYARLNANNLDICLRGIGKGVCGAMPPKSGFNM